MTEESKIAADDQNIIDFSEAEQIVSNIQETEQLDSDAPCENLVESQVVGLESDSQINESPDTHEPAFTDEEIDAVADTAIALIQDILKYFEVGEVTIDEYEGDEGELILDLTGGNLAVLIGRHGRTLDALQYLVSAILFKKLGFRYPLVVDVESYKSRQRTKLEDIAYDAAEKAIRQGRNVKLRPMTPYERRIVHVFLRDDDRVSTKSEGEGHGRCVVIIPN